jgi:hypothetical protein
MVAQCSDHPDETVEEDFVATVSGMSPGELMTVRMYKGSQAKTVGLLTKCWVTGR